MSLEAALQNANASIRELVESLGRGGRVDVGSIPQGALDWALAETIASNSEQRLVLVTANLDEAYRH
jgi:phosphoribosylformylglycinamidine (FGAM) synthase-like enzyme